MLEQFTNSAQFTGYENTVMGNWGQLKGQIVPWLAGVSQKWQDKGATHFELTFCLCTPQSKAPIAREAVRRLEESGVLHTGNSEQILSYLTGVRFNEKKSQYIVEARDRFSEIYAKVTELKDQPYQLREWLAANVNGMGFKESTHFLRNIGLGEHLAMFDVHLIRAMVDSGLLDKDSKEAAGGLAGKKYKELEQTFLSWAKKLGLRPAELDITLWLVGSGNKEIM